MSTQEMSTQQIDGLLAELRKQRETTLAAVVNVSREDLRYATGNARWSSARRTVLRLADHWREHILQLQLIRQRTGTAPTEPQMMLALAEQAWGDVLASVVGLSDEDLDSVPAPGQWSVRQVLQHMIKGEVDYRNLIEKALQGKVVAEGE